MRQILDRMRADAESAVDRFNATERALANEAFRLRERLAAEAPEIDNTDAPRPEYTSFAYSGWMLNSFANFDVLAADKRRIEFAPLPYEDQDKTPLRTMLIILRGRLLAAQYGEGTSLLGNPPKLRADLDDFERQINNLLERHANTLTMFREEGRALPGLADERLRAFADLLTPEPLVVAEDEDADVVADRMLRRAVAQLGLVGAIRSALAGQQLQRGEQQVFTKAVVFLRGEVDRLHEELHQRLSRGEGESRVRRGLLIIGRGSLRLGLVIATAAVTALVTVIVTAYLAKWFPGQGHPAKLSPATPTTR